MTLAQRIQHLTLLTSFFTLVLTGFALRYPTSWLATIFVNELVRKATFIVSLASFSSRSACSMCGTFARTPMASA